jgi:hypothetical protein
MDCFTEPGEKAAIVIVENIRKLFAICIFARSSSE